MRLKNYIISFSILLFVLLIILLISIFFQSNWLMDVLQNYNPKALIHFDRKCKYKAVALTIDDSTSKATKYLIEILDRYSSTATFFMAGERIEAVTNVHGVFPEKHQEIIELGNDVGNHLYNEDRAFLMNEKEFEYQLNITDNFLNQGYFQNNKRKWFRPSSFVPKSYMFDILDKYNYTMVLGNVHSFDRQISNTNYNINNLIGRIQSGDIIIVHDLLENVPYIEKLVIYLRSNGFKVLSLSDMSDVCSSKVLKKLNK